MGFLYTNLWRWWKMGSLKNGIEKEIFQWLHRRVEKKEWSVEKSQSLSKQSSVYEDAEGEQKTNIRLQNA